MTFAVSDSIKPKQNHHQLPGAPARYGILSALRKDRLELNAMIIRIEYYDLVMFQFGIAFRAGIRLAQRDVASRGLDPAAFTVNARGVLRNGKSFRKAD
jgi:hypothetical protein